MGNVNVYKSGMGSVLLGAGALASGAASITSWVPVAAASLTPNGASFVGRNVTVMLTSGASAGKTARYRITADNGAGTLTVAPAGYGVGGNPYSD